MPYNTDEEGKVGTSATAADAQSPLRSRRASSAAKRSDDASARQSLLSGRPKSVDLDWGNGAARGGGRASKDMGSAGVQMHVLLEGNVYFCVHVADLVLTVQVVDMVWGGRRAADEGGWTSRDLRCPSKWA